jgi:hypothetical protein
LGTRRRSLDKPVHQSGRAFTCGKNGIGDCFYSPTRRGGHIGANRLRGVYGTLKSTPADRGRFAARSSGRAYRCPDHVACTRNSITPCIGYTEKNATRHAPCRSQQVAADRPRGGHCLLGLLGSSIEQLNHDRSWLA